MHFNQPEKQIASGNAKARGLAQAASCGADIEGVRSAINQRMEQAAADGLLDGDGVDFLIAQRRFALAHDPHSMAELAGMSAGFGLGEDTLFTHLNLSVLRDRKQTALIDRDGCSAWAVGNGPDGPLLAKNRDFFGAHAGIQSVVEHRGEDISTGSMLCVGSFGAPGAYSSGINAKGLALADTAVATRDSGIGWLRYFLMSRLLAECSTVEEALTFIKSRVHAGGGTLILADSAGNVASVELGHRAVAIERGDFVWRTNHFVSAELAGANLFTDARNEENSRRRFGTLAARIGVDEFTEETAARMMTFHGPEDGDTSLCRHADPASSATISGSVFACRARTLYFAAGTPCTGTWTRFQLDR